MELVIAYGFPSDQTSIAHVPANLNTFSGPHRNLDCERSNSSCGRGRRRLGIRCTVSLSPLPTPQRRLHYEVDVQILTGHTANSKMRQRLRNLQDDIDTTSTRLSTLASDVSTMEGRVVSLDQALVNARSLGPRIDALEAESAGIKTLVNEQLHEYQALKESTDDFAAWTRSVADETASTRLLGLDSKAALRRTTRRVVERLLESEQGDIKAICGNLERLVIAPS